MNRYEFSESLGAHHPVTVSVTVAQAEQRERRGLPLPISGDPESDHAKELLRIRRERKEKLAADAAARRDTVCRLRVEVALFLEELRIGREHTGKLAADAAAEAAAPAVKTEAAGLSFPIEATPIRLAVVPVAGGKHVVALIDEDTGAAVALPLRFAAHVGNQLAKVAQVLGHDQLPLRGLGSPAVGVSQLSNRLGQLLDGLSDVTHLLTIGVGNDIGDLGSLPGMISGSIKTHKTSPSVGAPDSAVCDNQKPTEGDPFAALAAIQRRLVVGGRLAVAP